MKLTDNERREIDKLLDMGRPLPDKYRFLLFDDKREVELIWNGKTNEICNIVLPFQTIEVVDEPRTEKPELTTQRDVFDTRGRQSGGWTNKLIWGDNKLILSSLKNGPLREEIEANGGIKLIYIDPPFDVGADFSMDIEIGEDTFTKKPNILEEIAYRDTWGKGADSFIAMIYERLVLMRDLLAEDGSIYVHCDWRLNSFIRVVMHEIFGNYRNEIVWQRTTNTGSSKGIANKLSNDTDSILYFTKSGNPIFNKQYLPYSEEYLNRFKYEDNKGKYRWQYMATYSEKKLQELRELDMIRWPEGSKNPEYKQYINSLKGIPLSNLWCNVFHKRHRGGLLSGQRYDLRGGGEAGQEMDRQRPGQVRHSHHAEADDPGAAPVEPGRQILPGF